MPKSLATFIADEAGATAIEYGLITALIGAVIVGAVSAIGVELTNPFEDAAAAMQPKS